MTESQRHSQVTYNDEIDLGKVFRGLWDGKWLIGSVVFVATVAAVIIALMLPNIYRAEALLAPNHQSGEGSMSALAAQYGGLASLAGIDLSRGDVDKTALGLEILKSREFISGFIERHDLLVPLIAANGWDADSDELTIDADDFNIETKEWTRDVSPPRKTVPSRQEAYEEFLEILSVNQDNKTGFVTIAIEFYSPMVAEQWVDWLINDINAYVMQRDVAEAKQAIEYLNEQIANTSLSGLHSVFFNLIEEHTKTVMLANMSREYFLKTLDPAVVPELKAKPKRSLIVILAFLAGGILGVAIQFARYSKGSV